MSRADPERRRDIDGREGRDTLLVEKFERLLENTGLRAQGRPSDGDASPSIDSE
jgi:hypothetical protein